jgi:hypothetical protein
MTGRQFRKLALSLPEAIEKEHGGHPDFRAPGVSGKIFATLNLEETHGVLVLTPEQQDEWMRSEPGLFVPCSGAWGERGCTQVKLKSAKVGMMRKAVKMAWENRVGKKRK